MLFYPCLWIPSMQTFFVTSTILIFFSAEVFKVLVSFFIETRNRFQITWPPLLAKLVIILATFPSWFKIKDDKIFLRGNARCSGSGPIFKCGNLFLTLLAWGNIRLRGSCCELHYKGRVNLFYLRPIWVLGQDPELFALPAAEQRHL